MVSPSRATSASTWSARKPVTITASSTPAVCSRVSCQASRLLPDSSIRHLGLASVSGSRRLPWPAARMMARFGDFTAMSCGPMEAAYVATGPKCEGTSRAIRPRGPFPVRTLALGAPGPGLLQVGRQVLVHFEHADLVLAAE